MLRFMKIIAVTVLIVPLAATMTLGQVVWTPTSDSMALRVESVTNQSAVIDIKTTVPSQVLVWYGQTGMFRMLAIDVGLYQTDHSVSLPDLQPNSSYFYRVTLFDDAGLVTAQSDVGYFRTLE